MTCSEPNAPTYMYADVRVDGVRGGHERQLQQLYERAAGPRRGVQHVPPRHPPAGTLWPPLWLTLWLIMRPPVSG